MQNCKRMNRPCTCGKAVTYDRNGRVPDWDNGASCLTDNEMRGVLTLLLNEWRLRCQTMEVEAAIGQRNHSMAN